MKLIDRVKYFIPITFAIIFVLTFILFGILSIFGITPFKQKSNNLGIIFICVGIFLGFYPGMVLGTFIVYLIDKCSPNHVPTLFYQV
jgi:hypothetical protein